MKMLKCDLCGNIVEFYKESETFGYYGKYYDLCISCYDKICSIKDKYTKEHERIEKDYKKEISKLLKI